MGTFAGKVSWSAQEDELLLSLVESGVKRTALPPHFPHRTASAVKCRFDQKMKKRGTPMERRSRELANAINALIARMTPHEVADMLGKPHLKIPGTERIYRGQFAERKLAA
jgi:hypothetical protein